MNKHSTIYDFEVSGEELTALGLRQLTNSEYLVETSQAESPEYIRLIDLERLFSDRGDSKNQNETSQILEANFSWQLRSFFNE